MFEDVLAERPVPEALHTSLDALRRAASQCQRGQYGQEECTVLIFHCQTLVLEAERLLRLGATSSGSLVVDLVSVDRACNAVKASVDFFHSSLAWILLHHELRRRTLTAAETALLEAHATNKMDIGISLQADLDNAVRLDYQNLDSQLRVAGEDGEDIINILQADGYDSRPVKEVVVAFTKAARIPESPTVGEAPELSIIRTVAAALQHHFDRSSEISPWSLTSFEVDFDPDSSIIGRGAYGRIVKGIWKGQVVAVKEMSSRMSDDRAFESIRHEVQVWSQLNHPNILRFHGACLEISKPFIVSTLCKNGNALSFLRASPHSNRLRLLHGISVGMVYLHSQGIIHADLKASNILIGDNEEALIADFGLSTIRDQVSSSISVTRISSDRVGGTLHWMAPEVLEGKGLNKPADVYGFSLIAWEFYGGGAVPFASVDDDELFKALILKGERPERPQKVDDGIWKMITECWESDPYERPDFVAVERTLAELMSRPNINKTQDALSPDRSLESRKPIIKIDTSPSKYVRSDANARTLSSGSGSKSATSNLTVTTDTSPSFFKGLANLFRPPKSATFPKLPGGPIESSNESNERTLMAYAQTIPSLSRIVAQSSSASYRMNVTLSFLYNTSLTADGVSEILLEAALLPAVISRLLLHEQPESEKYLILGLLANLACRSKARKALIHQSNIVSILTSSLAPSLSLPVQEHATRCIYNLSTNVDSHRLIIGEKGLVNTFARLLSSGASTNHITNVLGCLTNLSHKEMGRVEILSTPEVISGLVWVIGSEVGSRAREQALMCFGNLSVEDHGVGVLLSHQRLIPSLAACLSHSPNGPVTSQTLRCLRNLSKAVTSHEDILRQTRILATLSDVLSTRMSSNQQRYTLHMLSYLVHSKGGRTWLRGEARNLQWFADSGSAEEKAFAGHCLGAILCEG